MFVPGFTQTVSSWGAVRAALAVDSSAVDVPQRATFTETASAIGDAGGTGTYVGYSLGGRLCLQLAVDRPDVVTRLVLVSASPGLADETARGARDARRTRIWRGTSSKSASTRSCATGSHSRCS